MAVSDMDDREDQIGLSMQIFVLKYSLKTKKKYSIIHIRLFCVIREVDKHKKLPH